MKLHEIVKYLFIDKLGLSSEVLPVAVCFSTIFNIYSQLMLPKKLSVGQKIQIEVLHSLNQLNREVGVVAGTPVPIVVPKTPYLLFDLLLVV